MARARNLLDAGANALAYLGENLIPEMERQRQNRRINFLDQQALEQQAFANQRAMEGDIFDRWLGGQNVDIARGNLDVTRSREQRLGEPGMDQLLLGWYTDPEAVAPKLGELFSAQHDAALAQAGRKPKTMADLEVEYYQANPDMFDAYMRAKSAPKPVRATVTPGQISGAYDRYVTDQRSNILNQAQQYGVGAGVGFDIGSAEDLAVAAAGAAQGKQPGLVSRFFGADEVPGGTTLLGLQNRYNMLGSPSHKQAWMADSLGMYYPELAAGMSGAGAAVDDEATLLMLAQTNPEWDSLSEEERQEYLQLLKLEMLNAGAQP